MRSDVYFIPIEAGDIKERVAALNKLLNKIAPFSVYKKDEFIPIKLTVGDSACIHNLSPELTKHVVLGVKNQGAKPFLFDTSVIYHGQRQNAVDHLNLIQSKGYGITKVGAPFIIADGLFGQDGHDFEINRKSIEQVKLPSFIGMLDNLIVLSHPTGHIISGFAGAIKNVAMGMSCRPTKKKQHSSIKPNIIKKKCVACGCCISACPTKAISLKDTKAFIEQGLCIGCGECICACNFDSIYIDWHEDPHIFCRRMVEVAEFILSKFKNKFFVNFAFEITKECDCISTKDEQMIALNLGILASFDPVSLDQATLDLARQANMTSFLADREEIYEGMLNYAARNKLGNQEYNLVKI